MHNIPKFALVSDVKIFSLIGQQFIFPFVLILEFVLDLLEFVKLIRIKNVHKWLAFGQVFQFLLSDK
jgi:hypothetical protein